jgi:methyl-accepting chemotaxis protein
MKASKARTRISPGYGAASILIAMALVVLAFTQMRTIKATTTRITGDTMPSIYLSGQLQSVKLLRYTLLTDYADADDKAKRNELDRQIDSANSQIDDVIGKYEGLIDSPADRRLFEALKSARTPYDECYIHVLRLRRVGKAEEAVNLTRAQLIPLRNAFLEAAEAEVAFNKADADNSVNAIKKAVNWSSTGIMICLVFGVGVACIALGIRKRFQAEHKLREARRASTKSLSKQPMALSSLTVKPSSSS